jgi:translation initiation factor IF-1
MVNAGSNLACQDKNPVFTTVDKLLNNGLAQVTGTTGHSNDAHFA